VLLVAYDVASRGPIAAVTPSTGMLAAALVLTPPGHATAGRPLRCTLLPGSAPADAARQGAAAGAWQPLLAGNAMAHCLPLFAALAQAGAAQLGLGIGPGSHLQVDVAGAA